MSCFCLLFILLYVTNVSFAQNATITTTNGTVSPTIKRTPIAEILSQTNRWPSDYVAGKRNARDSLANYLLLGCPTVDKCMSIYRPNKVEYPGFDGWYNNLARIDSGAIDTPLLRRWPAAYSDGTYLPSGSDRPNPMTLSEELLKLDQVGTKSKQGKTAFLVFFGQQLVEEILDAQRPACPPEYINIPIPEGHRLRRETGHTEMPLLRTRYNMRTGYSPGNPRQQLNEITPYLDGGLVYGTSKAWADYLRTQEDGTLAPDGKLACSDASCRFPAYNTQRLPMANPPPPTKHPHFVQQHELDKVSRFFKLGNPRGNENTFLLTFGILLFRWHNYLAENIKRSNPALNSEQIFNEARKWVIATHQHLVVDTWLPVWLGESNPLPPYTKYDPSIDPQIDQFFQAVAMRFGHTLVVPGVYLRDYNRNGCRIKWPKNVWPKEAVRTCNAYWRPQDAITAMNGGQPLDIDRVLMGLASQLCEQEDHKIVEDLRGNVFGPLEFSRRDLMAINIQRARDHGLPDFNTARKAFGLAEVVNIDTHYAHLEEHIRKKFKELHKNGNMSLVDPWVGGILETVDSGPGEFFRTVIKDQFLRIRNGDRFWFENKDNGLFTTNEIERIKKLTIYDVVMAVTRMDWNDIPQDPFKAYPGNEVPVNCIQYMNSSTFQPGGIELHHLPQLTADLLKENCTTAGTYDYFYNSEASYILTFTFISAFIIGTLGVVLFLTRLQMKYDAEDNGKRDKKVRETFRKEKNNIVPYTMQEWVSLKEPLAPRVIILDVPTKQIQVSTHAGTLIRALDFSASKKMEIYIINDKLHLMLKSPNEYDLIVKFDTEFLRDAFLMALENFVSTLSIQRTRIKLTLKAMYNQAVTKKARQKQLDAFFRVVFAQIWHISEENEDELNKIDSKAANEIIYTEITCSEFADALSLKKDSEFVRRIFHLIDKDKNGFISFREFMDLLFIFAKGSPRDKAKILFDMYDINKTDFLTEEEFRQMIKSFMEICHADVKQEDIDKILSTIGRTSKTRQRGGVSFEDFYQVFEKDLELLGNSNISFQKTKESSLDKYYDEIESLYGSPEELAARIGGEVAPAAQESLIDEQQDRAIEKVKKIPDKKTFSGLFKLSRTIETNFREIFWLSLFTLVLISIFVERAYYYSVEREHSGLRKIAGYGVTITRGAASAQMFTYSVLLLTMCRNAITILRDTVFNHYIPFDRSVEMHKYIACWALFFTILHIIGHAFNFYHISTQTADDLTCLFRNYFHATHELPKFHYWCWQTMTGITGVILTLITSIIFICALPGVNKRLFWLGHKFYPLFYVFMVLHGSGRLIQAPYFPYFFIGPVILFIIDNVISATRKTIELRVLKAELLPSDVTKLEIKRPSNFEFKSGQWVRLACSAISSSEFHPFTLSSSPDEENISVHIRAVGPWTRQIRSLYDTEVVMNGKLPRIHLDGPYGEGHQDWFRYDVSVLIGGGIGVTPFSSILKDIVHRANRAHKDQCRKVYFIWVTKTQKHFEWLVDIIRDLESKDEVKCVSTHLFITQFYQKFDLRTTLIYICERHFQRVSGGRSFITGLKAVTHFGRPSFSQFFKSLQELHPQVQNFGVFSCGPPPMTSQVDKDCLRINKLSSGCTFEHHYKNY